MQRSFAPDNDQTRVDIWTRSMIEGGYRPRWAPQAAPFSPVRPSETGYDLRGTSSPVTAMMPSSPPMGGGISGPWQQQQQQQQWVSPNDAKPQRTKSAGIWSKVKNVFGSNKGGQVSMIGGLEDSCVREKERGYEGTVEAKNSTKHAEIERSISCSC